MYNTSKEKYIGKYKYFLEKNLKLPSNGVSEGSSSDYSKTRGRISQNIFYFVLNE